MAFNTLQVLDILKDGERCCFCRRNVADELLLGKIYKYEDVVTHYFCMLFSSQMEQNGKDEEGILGFLPIDIKKELSRGTKIVCSYCHHEGATIACYARGCKKKFHYPCAVENGSMHQFFAQFRSYCFAHRRTQNVPQYACKLTEKYICVMCQDEVKPTPSLSTIWAPCCKTAWFHRICVQRMSVSAGYFFKCPNCNNKDEFRKEMRECGIYIPDQDASWELEPNAFNELSERYSSCDGKSCECPRGRSYSSAEGIWEVILCMFCGSQGIHSKCGKRELDDAGQWVCSLCSEVTSKRSKTSNRVLKENPGPSAESLNPSNINLNENTRTRASNSENRRYTTRRKRNLSPSRSGNSAPRSKRPYRRRDQCTASLQNNVTNGTTCLFGTSGEPIEVVHVGGNQTLNEKVVEIGGVNVDENIVQLVSDDDCDDDDEDDNIIFNHNSEAALKYCQDVNTERKMPPPRCDMETVKCPNIPCNDIIIDLLEDSDDEPHVNIAKTDSDCDKKENKDDDDDVIFMGCDILESSKNEDPIPPALIRFVENDTMYVLTPADIKKRGSLDAIVSHCNNNRLSNSENLFENRQSSSATSSLFWQSIPLHKSIVHSFSQSQNGSTTNSDNEIYKAPISNIAAVRNMAQIIQRNSDRAEVINID